MAAFRRRVRAPQCLAARARVPRDSHSDRGRRFVRADPLDRRGRPVHLGVPAVLARPRRRRLRPAPRAGGDQPAAPSDRLHAPGDSSTGLRTRAGRSRCCTASAPAPIRGRGWCWCSPPRASSPCWSPPDCASVPVWCPGQRGRALGFARGGGRPSAARHLVGLGSARRWVGPQGRDAEQRPRRGLGHERIGRDGGGGFVEFRRNDRADADRSRSRRPGSMPALRARCTMERPVRRGRWW